MRNFQHIAAPLRLFHGADSLARLDNELDRARSRRALIVCGSSLGKLGSPLDRVRAALGDRCAGIFTGVRAHSPVPSVEAAAREIDRLGADAVVAVGGGSAIVTARAASILAAENGDIRRLGTYVDEQGRLNSPKLLAPKLPQFVVPTTPTTAAAKAGSAVWDADAGKRVALFDPKTRAHSIFIHPELLDSAPRKLIVSASLNTFALALEGLISRTGDPLSDAMLMHALRLLASHLPSHAPSCDAAERGELMLAAILAGQGTDYTGAGMTIALGHAISARCEVDNGLANAIMMLPALRFNADAVEPRLQKLATCLTAFRPKSEDAIDTVTNAIEELLNSLQIPRRLRDAGVPRESLSSIAASVMDDWFLRGNPRPVTGGDQLQQILERAW